MTRGIRLGLTAGMIAVFLVVACALTVYADSWLPEGVSHWTDECGYTCYVFPDGSGECYPCLECEVTYDETTRLSTPVVAVDTPEPTPPPVNTPTPHDGEDTPEPTPKPTDECKPGHGHGDKNHCHSGPPGQNK